MTREIAPFGTLICDDYGALCDCCDRTVRRTRTSQWHGDHAICAACFAVWYEYGKTCIEDIKIEVLRAETAGTFPFPNTDAERVPT